MRTIVCFAISILNGCCVIPTSFWYVDKDTGKSFKQIHINGDDIVFSYGGIYQGGLALNRSDFLTSIEIDKSKYDTLTICIDSLTLDNGKATAARIDRQDLSYNSEILYRNSKNINGECLKFTRDSNSTGLKSEHAFISFLNTHHYWNNKGKLKGVFKIKTNDETIGTIIDSIKLKKQNYKACWWLD